jgi:predicted GH43/DUF377 family glycosyl hydrolase
MTRMELDMGESTPSRREFIATSIGLILATSLPKELHAKNHIEKELDFSKLLQPVQSRSILRSDNWHIWGGSMVRTPDGLCHLLFARWEKKYGFNGWVSNSEIAYAVSNDPLGPYEVKGTALPRRAGYWDADNTHNPTVMEFNGKYYLYYTGNYGNGEFWDHRNHQRAGVAVADHPSGAWKRFDRPLLEPTPNGQDHLLTSSPTVARVAKDRYVMVYKGVSNGKMPFGGNVRMGVAIADNPLGPFVKQNISVFDHPAAQFPTDDNFIWAQDGKLYAIVKDYGGHFSNHGKQVLLLFESENGLKWSVAEHDLVSKFEIRWEDGRITRPLHRLDQPQVWLENGKPSVLFLAVKEKDDKDDTDLSYNIHVGLRKKEK